MVRVLIAPSQVLVITEIDSTSVSAPPGTVKLART